MGLASPSTGAVRDSSYPPRLWLDDLSRTIVYSASGSSSLSPVGRAIADIHGERYRSSLIAHGCDIIGGSHLAARFVASCDGEAILVLTGQDQVELGGNGVSNAGDDNNDRESDSGGSANSGFTFLACLVAWVKERRAS